jgi:hypothetical protein
MQRSGELKFSLPDQANSSQDPFSKITRAKWTGGPVMPQVAKRLLCKCEALSLNSSHTKNNNNNNK